MLSHCIDHVADLASTGAATTGLRLWSGDIATGLRPVTLPAAIRQCHATRSGSQVRLYKAAGLRAAPGGALLNYAVHAVVCIGMNLILEVQLGLQLACVQTGDIARGVCVKVQWLA